MKAATGQFTLILKKSPWYFFVQCINSLSALILLPIYTRYLSPEELGQFHTLRSIGEFLPIFVCLQVHASFDRFYFEERKKSFERVQLLYSTLFWFTLTFGSLATLLILPWGKIFVPATIDLDYFPYIPLTILPVLFQQLALLTSNFLRSNLQSKRLALSNVISFIISSLLTIYLLIDLGWGIKSTLLGRLALPVFSSVYFLGYALQNKLLVFKFSYPMLKRSLSYSMPLLPAAAGSWVAGYSDKMILAYYGKVATLGYYSISLLISKVLSFINSAITQVQNPVSLNLLLNSKVQAKKEINEFLIGFSWIICLGYLAISLFSKELINLFLDIRYKDAFKVIPILCATYIFSGLSRPFTTILSFHKKMWIVSLATISTAITNGILNFIFIPIFAEYAAACSTVLSFILYSLIIISLSQRIDHVKVSILSILTPIFFSVIIISIYATSYFQLHFLIKLLAIFIYLFCFWRFGLPKFLPRKND